MPKQGTERHFIRICQTCRSAMIPNVGDLHFDHDGFEIIVTGVPMQACPACGEEYVPGPIAAMISDLVADKDLEGELQPSQIAGCALWFCI